MLAILTLALLYFMVALAYCYETVYVFGTMALMVGLLKKF